MRDTLVIDIETKNTFADVGGEENLKDLDVSLVGVYSYLQGNFLSFREDRLQDLGPVLRDAGLIIGFSINRFDLPVLDKYFDFDTKALPSFDLLDEIEATFGRRVSLDILARTNLGFGKTGHGLDAPKFYAAGDWESLERYCLHDVLITRDLYDLARKQGFLVVPERDTGELIKVTVIPKELEITKTLF